MKEEKKGGKKKIMIRDEKIKDEEKIRIYQLIINYKSKRMTYE